MEQDERVLSHASGGDGPLDRTLKDLPERFGIFEDVLSEPTMSCELEERFADAEEYIYWYVPFREDAAASERYTDALFRRTIEFEEREAPSEKWLPRILYGVGIRLVNQNRMDEAERLLRRAVEVARSGGEARAFLADSLWHLAVLCRLRRRDTESEELSLQALEIERLRAEHNPRRVAQLLSHLGFLYRRRRSFAAAMGKYREALGEVLHLGGGGGPLIREVLIALARTSAVQGRTAQRQAFAERARRYRPPEWWPDQGGSL